MTEFKDKSIPCYEALAVALGFSDIEEVLKEISMRVIKTRVKGELTTLF